MEVFLHRGASLRDRFPAPTCQASSRNHNDVETGGKYWISGPKKAGGDRLYGERVPGLIDPDARLGYWTEIRNQPERAHESNASR